MTQKVTQRQAIINANIKEIELEQKGETFFLYYQWNDKEIQASVEANISSSYDNYIWDYEVKAVHTVYERYRTDWTGKLKTIKEPYRKIKMTDEIKSKIESDFEEIIINDYRYTLHSYAEECYSWERTVAELEWERM